MKGKILFLTMADSCEYVGLSINLKKGEFVFKKDIIKDPRDYTPFGFSDKWNQKSDFFTINSSCSKKKIEDHEQQIRVKIYRKFFYHICKEASFYNASVVLLRIISDLPQRSTEDHRDEYWDLEIEYQFLLHK